ncbi:PEP-CTERM sorting domain-containing protein [Microcoleus sp. herbarium2]|uniref:PEP-CTERM sorting domain-containing protein n=1 Tax=Microcoleus sp. herbarium2 TaxID=3055433 RepID=UPI002FCEEAB0
MPRLGSAIASTILSVFWAVSLVGVDKAQAAVLTTYDFKIENGVGGGFFTVDSSSLTGIGYEEVGVSEGILNTNFVIGMGYTPLSYGELDDNYYLSTLAWHSAQAVFYQGAFLGLEGFQSGSGTYKGSRKDVSWSFDVYQTNAGMWRSSFSGYSQTNNPDVYGPAFQYPSIYRVDDAKVSYTEQVPEPLTAGGTALALAGLSWLKHKKKMAA